MTLSIGPRPPRVLVVDDEQSILDLLKRRLETLGCQVSVLGGGSEVAQTVREQLPDLVLLDVMMPDVDGFTVCKTLKADPLVRDIPVVLMTARSEVDSRIKGLEMGAHDYIAKPFETAELVARIRAALRVKHLQDELKEANKRLERLAASDPLTDLPNRRTFDEQFFMAVERSRRSGEALSVLMIDLDNFKRINDTYGHQVGDDALRHISRVLGGRRRDTDLVGRYGGEEFVWALPGAGTTDAMEVAEWLRRTVEEMVIQTDEGAERLTVSVGVTTYEPAAHGPLGTTAMLEAADEALRSAKSAGRNQVTYQALGVVEGAPSDAEAESEAAEDDGTGLTRYR